MMEMLQNLGLSVFPLLSGLVRDQFKDSKIEGFHGQSLFFLIIACLCLGASIIL